MQNVLIVDASPRPCDRGGDSIVIPRSTGPNVIVSAKSACAQLAAAFKRGLASRGDTTITEFVLREHPHINPCRACYGCITAHKCILKDDMQAFYPLLNACQSIVFVTPLYYATLPAQVLSLINRLYPYWIDDIRYPKISASVIGTCADLGQSWDLFDRTWHSIFGEIGWPERGILHAPAFMDTPEEYLAQAESFGHAYTA